MVENRIPKNVIFVSLDCATNWIVDNLIKQGELPNLSGLIKNGSYFTMQSEEPVLSPVVWTSIASGKIPEKHGVKSFFATADTVATKRMWDIFADNGYSVGIMGFFITWPPKKVNGFMVPDLLAMDSQAYPAEYGFMHDITAETKANKKFSIIDLAAYFLKAWKNGIQLNNLMLALLETMKKKLITRDFREEIYCARKLKQLLYTDFFIHLYKKFKPGFASFHNHLIDSTSHEFWRYFEPDKFPDVSNEEISRYGSRIYDSYREADKTLGKILKLADENTLIVVASDHGAKSLVDSAKYWHTPLINSEILMQELKIEKEVSYSTIGFDIIVKPRIDNNSAKIKLKELFSSIIIEGLNVPLFNIFEYDNANIWLRVNNSVEKLKGLRVNISDKVYEIDKFVKSAENKASGIHDGKAAILILCGAGVNRGFKGEKPVSVLDVLPTILTIMNFPVGKDMDGKIIREAINEQFLEKFPTKYIDSYDDPDKSLNAADEVEANEVLKNHLKALGYL